LLRESARLAQAADVAGQVLARVGHAGKVANCW
jgi:hypothetical protein